MAKNTGKPAEKEFEEALDRLGKAAYYYRFKDAAAIKGLTGKTGNVDMQPSDYIVVIRGLTSFAEVKSTHNATSFPFGMLKTGQKAHGLRITAAGGSYLVFVKNMLTGVWYCVPRETIEDVRAAGHQSIKWADLGVFKWHP